MQLNKFEIMNSHNRGLSILLTLAPTFFLCIPLGGELISLATLLYCLIYFAINPIFFKGVDFGIFSKAVLLSLGVIFVSKCISIIWSIDPALTYREIKKYSHFLIFIPYFYAFKLIDRPDKILVRGFLLALSIVFFMSIHAWVNSGFVISGIGFSGGLKNSLVFSAIFLLMVFGVVGDVIKFNDTWVKFFIVIGVAFICLMNGKKTTVLAVLLGAVYFYYYQYKGLGKNSMNGSKRIAYFSFFLLALIFLLTLDKWVLIYDQVIGYFSSGTYFGSTDTRLKLFEIGLLSWWNDGFLFGQGAGTARAVIANTIYADGNLARYNHYHNIIVNQLADIGLLGSLIFFGALAYLQRSMINFRSKFEFDWSFNAWKNSIIPVVIFFGLFNIFFGVNVLHLFLVYILAGIAALEA